MSSLITMTLQVCKYVSFSIPHLIMCLGLNEGFIWQLGHETWLGLRVTFLGLSKFHLQKAFTTSQSLKSHAIKEPIFGKPTQLRIYAPPISGTTTVSTFVEQKLIQKILELTCGLLSPRDEMPSFNWQSPHLFHSLQKHPSCWLQLLWALLPMTKR